jgi:hypothetical protein
MRRGRTIARTGAVLALVVSAGWASAGRAESPAVSVHGLLDLALTGHSEAAELNLLWKGDSRFDAYAARIFVDGSVTDRLEVLTQLLADEAVGARAFGAYAQYRLREGHDVHLIAGLIPWLIGTFDARSYSDQNPLVGVPMMYQTQTTLRWDQFPANADVLLAAAGSGYEGVSYAAGARSFPGMPVVYQHWWDFGVGLIGSERPFEFSVGLENGTPSFPDPVRDENASKSLAGRLGLAPTPALRFGVSGAYGGYAVDGQAMPLPAGRRPEDFHQTLLMGDAEWAQGHVVVRGEGFLNAWETPTVGVLRVRGGYAEVKVTLPASFYVAGRYEIQRYSDVRDSTGVARPWDAERDRGEVGVGYRVARGALAKVVHQWNLREANPPSVESERESLVAGQLSIRF